MASIDVPRAPDVEVRKDDHQKADDAAVPTQMWDYFFEKSFLSEFGLGAPEGECASGHEDVFRRHDPRRWTDLLEGCKAATNGFC